jgi:hypothetical protein
MYLTISAHRKSHLLLSLPILQEGLPSSLGKLHVSNIKFKYFSGFKVKVKISLLQAMEAHRVARG